MEVTFEKERVNNFTDAVFAIAMTLLILEVPIPNYKSLQALGFLGAINAIYLDLLGYAVSFLVTGLYWNAHMKFSRYITSYSERLFRANLLLLLFIVLIPFSTGLFFKNFSFGPFIWYAGNLTMVSLLTIRCAAVGRKSGLIEKNVTASYLNWVSNRLWGTVLVWGIVMFVAQFSMSVARFLPLLMIPLLAYLDSTYKRTHHKKVPIANPE